MADIVVCCGTEWDRDEVAYCGMCGANLWSLGAVPPPPPPPPENGSGQAGETDFEDDPGAPPSESLEVVVDGRTIVVAAGKPVVLGRDDDLDSEPIFRQLGNVSRHHAVLEFDGEHVYVTDLKSSNKTFVNDLALEPEIRYEFRPGQRLRFGSKPPVPVEVRWPT